MINMTKIYYKIKCTVQYCLLHLIILMLRVDWRQKHSLNTAFHLHCSTEQVGEECIYTAEDS